MTKKPKAGMSVVSLDGQDHPSGVGFNDTMHFEVSEERIREWSKKKVLK